MPVLKTVLGQYPHMRALRDGTVRNDRVKLEFVEFRAVGAAFNDMLRDQRYDVCEMALVAFMQAVARGVPVRMLPVVALGGYVHGCIRYCPSEGPLVPAALAGKRVGVRSYSQTTGVWARGALAQQFGVDLQSVHWIATDGAHVEGFTDPANVTNLGTREQIGDLVLQGRVDAGILHPNQEAPAQLSPLIPDLDRWTADWFDRHRIVPVNHVVCVGPSVWQDADLVAELSTMFAASYRRANVPAPDDHIPVSYDRSRIVRAAAVASDLAQQQHLIDASFDAANAILAH